jgi:hypothetical protein
VPDGDTAALPRQVGQRNVQMAEFLGRYRSFEKITTADLTRLHSHGDEAGEMVKRWTSSLGWIFAGHAVTVFLLRATGRRAFVGAAFHPLPRRAPT